jgi:hypothetical protein
MALHVSAARAVELLQRHSKGMTVYAPKQLTLTHGNAQSPLTDTDHHSSPATTTALPIQWAFTPHIYHPNYGLKATIQIPGLNPN